MQTYFSILFTEILFVGSLIVPLLVIYLLLARAKWDVIYLASTIVIFCTVSLILNFKWSCIVFYYQRCTLGSFMETNRKVPYTWNGTANPKWRVEQVAPAQKCKYCFAPRSTFNSFHQLQQGRAFVWVQKASQCTDISSVQIMSYTFMTLANLIHSQIALFVSPIVLVLSGVKHLSSNSSKRGKLDRCGRSILAIDNLISCSLSLSPVWWSSMPRYHANFSIFFFICIPSFLAWFIQFAYTGCISSGVQLWHI